MSTTPEVMVAMRRRAAAGEDRRAIARSLGLRRERVDEVLDRPPSGPERLAADKLEGWTAACMDPVEWAEWKALNPRLPFVAGYAVRPCDDCPMAFAADMRAQGRCNGEPQGVATEPDEPEEDPMDTKRIPVALEAPCPRCSKADVCGLRASVEELATIPVLIPDLDPRLGVVLAGSVTCAAFDRARVRRADVTELDRRVSRTGAHGSPKTDAEREERGRIALEALARHAGDEAAAAAELGWKRNALAMVVKHARLRQDVPA